MRLGLFALAGALGFGLSGPSAASGWPEGPEAAAAALRSGDWEAAEREYRGFVEGPGCARDAAAGESCIAARRGLAETLRLTGRYADAVEVLEAEAASSSPGVLLDRARIHLEVGEAGAASGLLRRLLVAPGPGSLSETVEAASLLGRLELRLGERESGLARLDGVLDAYNTAPVAAFTPRGLVAVGTAAATLGFQSSGLFRDALRVFDDAAALDPDDPAPRIAAGELLLSKFNSAEALESFQAVLSGNPRHPEALFGVARIPAAMRGPQIPGAAPDGAGGPLERALEANPVHPPARALEIHRLLEAGRLEEARARAEDAAEALPKASEVLVALGAVRFVGDDQDALRDIEARFVAAWPGDPAFHIGMAEAAERQRLYREAGERARAALALAPASAGAARLLGLNQLRLGDIEDGRQTLAAAFERDPFDALLKNNLDLLDELAGFEALEAPPFDIALPADEAELLGPYVAEVAAEALETFRDRYGFEPQETIRIEMYDRSADFSVRTVGIPGIGAHGVCFGVVVAMESPSAREVGSYHWASTLWHELAHAVHMGMTGNRVPRWFTEGLSVLEERRRFGDGAPFLFYAALRDDRLLDLPHLDEGFIRPTWPGQVGVSYFHASLVLETMEDLYGFGSILAALKGFREGRDFSETLQETAGVSAEELDELVDAVIEERYGAAARNLSQPPGPRGGVGPPAPAAPAQGAVGGPDELLAAADAAPEDFVRQLRAGAALAEAGRDEEAEERLMRALEIAPGYGGADGPRLFLSRIHERAGRTLEAERALSEHLARAPAAYEEWVRLAALRRDAGNLRGAAAALTAAGGAYPFFPESHIQLADLAAELGETGLEIREREAVLASGAPDRAEALYRLALAHARAGEPARARRRVLEALEIAPTYDPALRLLVDLRSAR